MTNKKVSTMTEEERKKRLEWFNSARFGCFVHWGAYSVLGGFYKDKKVDGLAEWIQNKAEIPRDEYHQILKSFSPDKFNAEEWIKAVADAGMRYFVYTAKHHDGFAMYKSEVSSYNVVDFSKLSYDPLAEIAKACKKYGVKLGIYYSHVIDWEDLDANVGWHYNKWDADPNLERNFCKYWQNKANPQLKEILTNYGDISVIWFDMPNGIPDTCVIDAYDLVRELQPKAVINGRIEHKEVSEYADYISQEDNYFKNIINDSYWETAATTNESWAFTKGASGWKTPDAIAEALTHSCSLGGNYLLNIGPDESGSFPQEALSQMKKLAKWLDYAGEGIYGATRRIPMG